jgi:hypothetical protein
VGYKSGILLKLGLTVLQFSCEENANRFIELAISGIGNCAAFPAGKRLGTGVIGNTEDDLLIHARIGEMF